MNGCTDVVRPTAHFFFVQPAENGCLFNDLVPPLDKIYLSIFFNQYSLRPIMCVSALSNLSVYLVEHSGG